MMETKNNMRVLLIAYDNESHVHQFPLGLAYIASAARDAGHEVVIYNQDMYHYPPAHLTDYLNTHQFDVVGLGFCAGYWQYRKFLEISKAISMCSDPPLYVLGGHGPSPEPEYFLEEGGADVVVMGEGERTFADLLNALETGRDLALVLGIACLDYEECLEITGSRDVPMNLDEYSLPAWDLFPMDYYPLIDYPKAEKTDRCMAMLTSRGCPFKCKFCFRMDEGVRLRSVDSVVEEMGFLRDRYGITYIMFFDELLMSSPKRIVELCEGFMKANLNIKWFCNGRLNLAKLEYLKLMKEAGCVFINYGIEAMDDEVLRLMNKKLTTKQIVDGIEATLAAGISPGFNIIFGNIGDTAETLEKGVELLLKYDDHAELSTIRPVTPYPGCELYYYAIENGLLKDVEDFYKHKHINSDLLSVNFTDLSDREFHDLLRKANRMLIANYYLHQVKKDLQMTDKLYSEKDSSFRGFRQT